jgi:hypothetical protein
MSAGQAAHTSPVQAASAALERESGAFTIVFSRVGGFDDGSGWALVSGK